MGIILDLNGLEEMKTGSELTILLWYVNNLIYIHVVNSKPFYVKSIGNNVYG